MQFSSEKPNQTPVFRLTHCRRNTLVEKCDKHHLLISRTAPFGFILNGWVVWLVLFRWSNLTLQVSSVAAAQGSIACTVKHVLIWGCGPMCT